MARQNCIQNDWQYIRQMVVDRHDDQHPILRAIKKKTKVMIRENKCNDKR